MFTIEEKDDALMPQIPQKTPWVALKIVAAFFGSAVVFALIVLAWPDARIDRPLIWELLPWLMSFILWCLGTYQWVARTSSKWLAIVGSVTALASIVVSNLLVALAVSCIQGLCL